MTVRTAFALTMPGTDTLVPADVVPTAGVWDLVRPERRDVLDRFAADYAAVRTAEQRELTPDDVRGLPNLRPDHPLAEMWAQRAASYQRLTNALAARHPTAKSADPEVTDPTAVQLAAMVDIGAGCGWLAADFVRRGWAAAAIDITIDGGDGLAAARHHRVPLTLIRAEMQWLPFATDSVDLAVFNASLHYAGSVRDALDEAIRVVRPGGLLAVVDSPVFTDPAAGDQMVAEFAAHVEQTHGLPAAAHQGPGFMTEADLANRHWTRSGEPIGLKQQLHRWRGARRAGRETAQRPLLLTHVTHQDSLR